MRISDEGAGIEAKKLEKIYDKFYQCEESHKGKGSGLGLSIVRRNRSSFRRGDKLMKASLDAARPLA